MQRTTTGTPRFLPWSLGLTLLCAVHLFAASHMVEAAQEETPWQTHSSGSLRINKDWNMAMGYHFTPLVDGQVTALGAYVNGTKRVRLFDTTTGTLMASVIVSAANTWSYKPIVPLAVKAGTTYTVAVYLNGSGGSYRSLLRPVLPQCRRAAKHPVREIVPYRSLPEDGCCDGEVPKPLRGDLEVPS